MKSVGAYWYSYAMSGLPPCGGSGLKCTGRGHRRKRACLPPYGGSGLKLYGFCAFFSDILSPSIRREWIEIPGSLRLFRRRPSLPPYGGSGLKYCQVAVHKYADWSPSIRREWIEMQSHYVLRIDRESPSIRREWIEIILGLFTKCWGSKIHL